MVKCVVSGCRNRAESSSGFLHRTQKRFFRFPTDPARVQVWLAALRETDKQDSVEHHLICEDHFLPEDLSTNGVSSDAIPIMPPCPDGPLDMMGPWGAEPEEEEDQWAVVEAGGDEDMEEDEEEDGVPFNTKLPEPDIPQLDPLERGSGVDQSSGIQVIRGAELQREQKVKVASREELSLAVLTRGFLELVLKAPNGLLDLRHVITILKTRRRRVYDITNVLQGIQLIDRQSVNCFKWTGTCPISSFLDRNHIQEEMKNLQLVEDSLDYLIRTVSQQLMDVTDDPQNAGLAYVTLEDLSGLQVFQDQTLISVKAPEETLLEVPAPTQESIRVHLKGGTGPIWVRTCDIKTGDGTKTFLKLEDSRIKTALLRPDPHSA